MSLNKDKFIYVRACVIANGKPDALGCILTKKEIKQIFSNSIQVRCDLNHEFVSQYGVDILETTISTSDQYITKELIPTGSWIVLLRISNSEIQEMINKGEINGVSLTVTIDTSKESKIERPVHKVLSYDDIKNIDSLNPEYLSLVEHPRNQIPFEVMNYKQYISNGFKEEHQMTENILETLTITNNEEDDNTSRVDKFLAIMNQLMPTRRKPSQADLTEQSVSKKEEIVADETDKTPIKEEDKPVTNNEDLNMVEEQKQPANAGEDNIDLAKQVADLQAKVAELEKANEPVKEPVVDNAEPEKDGNEAEPEKETESEPENDIKKLVSLLEQLLAKQVEEKDEEVVENACGNSKTVKNANEETTPTETTEPDREDVQKIKNSQATEKVEMIKNSTTNNYKSFAEMTGRDPVTFERL